MLPADGDRVAAAAVRQLLAASAITDRVVAVAGEIGQPALAAGQAVVVAADGAVVVAALAVAVLVVSVAAVSGDNVARCVG